eukprot:3304779-Amphidinium_carterae.1
MEEITHHIRPRSESATSCNTLKNHETNLEQYYTITHEFIKTFQNKRDEIFNYEQAVSEIGSTMKMTLLIEHIQGDIKSYLLLHVNLAKADFDEAATKVEDYYRNLYIDNSSGGGIQALGKPKKPWKPWKGKGDKNNRGKDWKGGKRKYDQQPYKPWKGKGK